MKKKNIGLQYAAVLWIVIIFILICFTQIKISVKEPQKTADGFTIDKYEIILDVKENNRVFVTENITVDWYERYHHGIYKFTPEWLEYTGRDGKTIKRKSNIYNLKAVGDEYSTDTVKKKSRIKIGNSRKYVPIGLKTYSITYQYDMGKDPYKNFDEFIFHAFGDYWGTQIKNASITVTMPKSIKDANINFFTDKYRQNNVTKYVNYIVNENTIQAKFNEDQYYKEQGKKLSESLTIDIELPEGYFVGGSYNYGIFSFIISIVIIGLTIYVIYLWKKYGKDHPKKEQTVEFYPPDNLSSAEIGYIYAKQKSKKQTISLIISLASKGYIKIDEIKEGKIQITNNIGKRPPELKKEEYDKQRMIEVRKLKDYDETLSKQAINMMKYLFKEENTRQIKANIKKFLNVKEELVQGKYIQILRDTEKEIQEKQIEQKKEYEKQLKEYNEKLKEYEQAIEKLEPMNEFEQIVFDELFFEKDVIIFSEHKSFYLTFSKIDSKLEKTLKHKINDKNADKKYIKSILITIFIIVLSMISFFIIEDMSPNLSFLYYISFGCIFINIFFTSIMKRKTEYGETVSARVAGFREFLDTVEKEKLEALVEEEPNYFYNILPYTYVLNISKKWIEKFENIPLPQVEMGNFNYCDNSRWDDLYHNVYYPVVSNSGSSGSGCSSCGGGCSSCGGGCSSCGGGGSW